MRLLIKLVTKFAFLVATVVLMGGGLRHGSGFLMRAAGMEAPQFSSEESDLMSTVFQSALRLFSGAAKRDELASELSDKLYAGRAEAGTMSELGIEIVKPGGEPSSAGGVANAPHAATGASAPHTPSNPGANPKSGAPMGDSPASHVRTDLLAQCWVRAKGSGLELSLVPVVFLGMVFVQRRRAGRSSAEAFMPPVVAIPVPDESEPYEMKHAVHALDAEDFELLAALIYQRQGYRISMPSGLSGGRGGDFTLLRKAERVLVQCKKFRQEHKVHVDRVRELHEAMCAAAATRALYVASCGFTWDARNFAKTRKITLINARTLDELITAAREQPNEDLLAIASWAPKLMSKVTFTPPLCPACEAAMDQINVSERPVWVCSQRPDCRGRRSTRRYQKPAPASVRLAEPQADPVVA